MSPMEAPTPRARRLVQRKRQFFVVAGLLFATATAVLAWAVASGGTAGFVVFPLLVMLALFSALLPIGVGNYIEDYDQGRAHNHAGPCGRPSSNCSAGSSWSHY
jgi:hypothetical protein